MKIYLLNLDRDAERRAWMAEQLSKLDAPYERVPAFTPETTPDRFRRRFRPTAEAVLLPRNIASFATHLHAAEKLCADPTAETALVLEDDVEILCDMAELTAIAEAGRAFDMIKLNDWPKTPSLTVAACGDRRLIRYWQTPRGAGAHILTKAGAARWLERAQDLAITTDNFLRAEAYAGLSIAGVTPPPIPQDRFGASSLDPTGARAARRRPRYAYGAQGPRSAIGRAWRFLSEIGPVDALRMAATLGVMKARGVKRDETGAYVLKPWRARP